MMLGWRVSAREYASRDEWLSWRRQDVTASEAGALFGVHKYLTARKLTYEKAYGESRQQNSAMRRGKIMEPAVAEAVHVDFGWRMRRSETYLQARAADPLVRLGATRDYHLHLERDQLLASPLREQALSLGWDEFESMNLACECKSVDPVVFDNEWGETVPKYHLVQAAQQALLADADGAVVACLLNNRSNDLYLYAVPRKPTFEAELIERVREFWRRCADGIEYPPAAADNAEMSTYFPEVNTDQVIDLSDDPVWEARARELMRLRGEIKKLEARIDALEVLFKDAMRGAARAILPGWSVTWRADTNGKRRFVLAPAKAKKERRR